MHILILIARGGARAWHATLGRRLRILGYDVAISATAPPLENPTGLPLLIALERLLYRRGGSGEGAPIALSEADQPKHENADLVIDLAGLDTTFDVACLRPLCDGVAGEAGIIAALLDGRSPLIVVTGQQPQENSRVVISGVAAIEEPRCFTASFDRVCGRLVDLVVATARRIDRDGFDNALTPPAIPARAAALAPLRFGVESLAVRIAARLTRLAGGGEAWRIAWRRVNGDAIHDTLRWPDADYTVLPDDGSRYYADPFVFQHGGEIYVFCEEFPYATNRGLLSVFTISRDGVAGTPRPVLEAPYHLSYPMIFQRGDAIFMIPETSAANGVELWRAERFPDRWVKQATIIEGIAASDATLVEHQGRFWLFATVGDEYRSSWDALHLFHAERIEGPWTAHPENPVLIDARAARPAGHMFERDGKLWRPAQDCSGGYGSALAFCSVDRLDPESYVQRVERHLSPPASWRAGGAHTLNAAGDFEAIDILASASNRLSPEKPGPAPE